METFFHLLRRLQLGQDTELLSRLCVVGHSRYTTQFGLLLMKYFMANQRRAFMPYSTVIESDDAVDAKAAKAATAAAMSVLQSAGGANHAAGVWANLMHQGEVAVNLQSRMHDVRLLQNVAACLRLVHSTPQDVLDAIENFVAAITSPSAHQTRLDTVASVYACRRRHPTGDFSAERSFRGRFEGYVFGCGNQGLGYYADKGGPPMSPEVEGLVKEFKAAASTEIVIAEGASEAGVAVSEISTVQVGSHALISWEDGQKYEAVVIQLEPQRSAVRWRYLPSTGWDAWEETIPLSLFKARGVEIIHREISPSSSRHDGTPVEQLERRVDDDGDAGDAGDGGGNGGGNGHDDVISPAIDALQPPSASSAADFGDVNEDCQSMARLEDLAVSLTSEVLQQHGFTVDIHGWNLFLASAKATAHGTPAAAQLEEAVTGWFHGGKGRFEMVSRLGVVCIEPRLRFGVSKFGYVGCVQLVCLPCPGFWQRQ